MRVPVLTADQAAEMVFDGETLAIDGSGGGVNEPDAVLAALERRFLGGGGPIGITVLHPSGMGDGEGSGIDRLGHEGLVRRVIGGHWGWSSRMQSLAAQGKIAAYCLPQGVLSHLLRETAGGRPGVITHVGLGTAVDPRHQGGRLNATSPEGLVEVMEIDGREWLFYRSIPIDVAVIRGTQVDEHGNMTMSEEGLFAETLSMAQAAKNSGGRVIVQAREQVAAGSLDPRAVKVPGVLVDAIVLEPTQRLSRDTARNDTLVGAARSSRHEAEPFPMSERKVIARRAALELHHGDVVNLGFGMPDGVAAVLAEAGRSDAVTFTVEQGHVGGVPAGGRNFGLAFDQAAMIDAGHQFDWYDGGGLDIAVLSFAQIDACGDVNVGKFGSRMPGVGGFINISQGAKRLVFVGTLMVGATLRVEPSGITIVEEGHSSKFVDTVEQISFSGTRATARSKEVLYVTERAVFRLCAGGLELIEVAPGLDPETDIAKHIGFPIDTTRCRPMSTSLFRPEPMPLAMGEEAGS